MILHDHLSFKRHRLSIRVHRLHEKRVQLDVMMIKGEFIATHTIDRLPEKKNMFNNVLLLSAATALVTIPLTHVPHTQESLDHLFNRVQLLNNQKHLMAGTGQVSLLDYSNGIIDHAHRSPGSRVLYHIDHYNQITNSISSILWRSSSWNSWTNLSRYYFKCLSINEYSRL